MPLNCEDIVRQALGRNMRDDEVLDFARDAARLAQQVRAAQRGSGMAPDIAAYSRHWAKRKQLAVLARQRAEELQAHTRLLAVRHAQDNFQGMEWEGVSSLMVGSKYLRNGARYSVDAIRTSMTQHYLGSMVNELERLGGEHLTTLRKGILDRDIAQALWSLTDKNITYQGPKEALDIARIVHKWQERARTDENHAGAWINELPGYIVRQSHDQLKIKAAGYDRWRADIESRLDWQRTADGRLADPTLVTEREKFLEEVYTGFVTGLHEKFAPPGQNPRPDPLTSARTMGTTAAQASKPRVLHFQDGHCWYEYNQLYGQGQLVDGIISGLTKSANDTALMRVFGPIPSRTCSSLSRTCRRCGGPDRTMSAFAKWPT